MQREGEAFGSPDVQPRGDGGLHGLHPEAGAGLLAKAGRRGLDPAARCALGARAMTAAPALTPSFRIVAETAADRADGRGPGAGRLRSRPVRQDGRAAARDRPPRRRLRRPRGRPADRLGAAVVDHGRRSGRALFLGPIAVAPKTPPRRPGRRSGRGLHRRGAGTRAWPASCWSATSPYFERFGFQPAPDVRLPGPADPRRVLWLPITSAAPAGLARPA